MGMWCRARSPTVTSGAGAMLMVADFLLQGALVGGGGVAVDALWRVRWRCREVSDFRGPLWTARVDAPTLVHDLAQRRFSRAGFSWRPSRWCRRPLGGSRGSRGGGWRALSGCWLPVGIMDAPAAGAGSVAMRVMGPGEVSDASPGLVEPVESVRGWGQSGGSRGSSVTMPRFGSGRRDGEGSGWPRRGSAGDGTVIGGVGARRDGRARGRVGVGVSKKAP